MTAAAHNSTPIQDNATMAALPRRTFVLAVVILPVVLLTVWLVVTQTRSMRRADVARQAVPATITQADRVWTSIEMSFTEAEMAILETNDYVYRSYMDTMGSPVDLCIVFSEDNRKGTHPPDVCLTGGGARVDAHLERTVKVAGDDLHLRELVVTHHGRTQYFAYFYKVGDSFTPSFYTQQAMIIWYGLTGRNAAGALVRYSTAMPDPSAVEEARARTDELLAATYPDIRAKLNAQ